MTVTFEALYRSEHVRLVRRVFLMTGSQMIAEDVVHETFVELLRRWEHVESPAAYLQRSVLNNAVRAATRRRREIRLSTEDRHHRADPAVDHMRDALLALPVRQRAAIVLRFYEDRSEREIAALLGCRPGTVGPLITRGLRRLEEVIER